jgi:hypothetical protein
MSSKDVMNVVVFNYLKSVDVKIAGKFQKAAKLASTELPTGTKSIQEMVEFFQG